MKRTPNYLWRKLTALMLCFIMGVSSLTVCYAEASESTEETEASVSAVSVSLNKSKASVALEKTVKLKATVSGTSSKVTWSTSKKSVATVSAKGVVKGKKAGTATITATVDGQTAACTVTVTVDLASYMNGSISKLKKAVGSLKFTSNDPAPETRKLYISTTGDSNAFFASVSKSTKKIELVQNLNRTSVKVYGVSIGNSVSAAHKKLLKKGFRLSSKASGVRDYKNGTFWIRLFIENSKVTGYWISRL
ncbi:MAG: Ig-like domain-containing protein [Lachnospiraceae bacterium]|nr:Ig-like domain-containing protein [Lachnospiraceae bacterium]